MDHEIRHDLSVAEATSVAHRALDAYAQRFARYAPELSWRSERAADVAFTAKGIRLEGALEVQSDRFCLHLEVPFLLRPFQKRAIKMIDDEVQGWLAQAKPASQ